MNMKKYLFAGTLLGLLLSLAALALLDTNLHYGSTGKDVISLQEFLKQQNVYSGPISGNFYSLTLAGVKKFQSAEGITPISGYVGPITRGVINQILDGQVASSEGDATTTKPAVDLSTSNSTTSVQSDRSDQIKTLLALIASLNDKIDAIKQTQTSQLLVQQQTAQNTAQIASSSQATAQNTQQTSTTLIQTQQSVQQIQQNTTPPPSTLPPLTPQVVKDLTVTADKTSVQLTSWNYVNVSAMYTEDDIVKPSNIYFSTPDGKTEKYLYISDPTNNTCPSDAHCQTGPCPANCKFSFYYLPKTLGTNTITVTASGVTKTVDISAVPYVKVDPMISGVDFNPIVGPTGTTSGTYQQGKAIFFLVGNIVLTEGDEPLRIGTIRATGSATLPTEYVITHLGAYFNAGGDSWVGEETYYSSRTKTHEIPVWVNNPRQVGDYTLAITSMEVRGALSGRIDIQVPLPITFHYSVQ